MTHGRQVGLFLTVLIVGMLALSFIFFATGCHKSTEVKTEQEVNTDVSNDTHEATYQDAEKNTGHEADTAKQTQTETQKGPVTTDKEVIEEDYGPAYPYEPEKPIPPRVLTHRTDTKTKTASGETTKKQVVGETGKVTDAEAMRTQTSTKNDENTIDKTKTKTKSDTETRSDTGPGWKFWLGISAAAATALVIGWRFLKAVPWVRAALGAVKGLFGKG